MTQEKKYDVFISYRREGGKNIARLLKTELGLRGYHAFLDFDELKDGRFDKRIMDAIDAAPVFMFILSDHALDRCVDENDWVRKEIEYAMATERHIIPINPDKSFSDFPEYVPKNLKDGLGLHQFSQLLLDDLFNQTMDKLVAERLESVLGKRNRYQMSTTGATIHLNTDANCEVYRYGKHECNVVTGEDKIVYLKKGKHKFEFVSIDDEKAKYSMVFTVEDIDLEDLIEITLLPTIQEREAAERLRKEQEERERVRKEQEEQERLRKEQEEQERIRKEQEEQERLRKEQQVLQILKVLQDHKVLQEQQEQERIRKEQEERERVRKEQEEQERLRKEQEEQERIRKEQEEQERIRKEQEEQERIRKEQIEATPTEKEAKPKKTTAPKKTSTPKTPPKKADSNPEEEEKKQKKLMEEFLASAKLSFNSKDMTAEITKYRTKATAVVIPETVIHKPLLGKAQTYRITSIGKEAFSTIYGNWSLQSIQLPNSITHIGKGAFQFLSGLTSITIPDGVTTIEDKVFLGCHSLVEINLPRKLTSIGDGAFFSCESLQSLVIPEGVKKIGSYTFHGCSSLTSISLPASLSSLCGYNNPFKNCDALKEIIIPKGTRKQFVQMEAISHYGNQSKLVEK